MKQYIFKIGPREINLHIIVQRNPNNGSLVLGLQDVESGELFDEITTNMPLVDIQCLNTNGIIAYEWQENLHQWLVDNKIATYTGEHLTKNGIKMPVMKLTPEFIEENKDAIASAPME